MNLNVLEKDIFTNIDFDVDIIIVLVSEDLTYSEWEKIQLLHQRYYPCLIAFNKQDQYEKEDKKVIIEKIRQQVKPIIDPNNFDNHIQLKDHCYNIIKYKYLQDNSYEKILQWWYHALWIYYLIY